jgi:hypothetical protein
MRSAVLGSAFTHDGAFAGVPGPSFLCPSLVLLWFCAVKISKGLKQAYAVQDFAFDAIEALKAQFTGEDGKLKLMRDDAMSIAQVHRVWQGAQERISFHRRVPSPGSLKPEKQDKQKPRKPFGPISAA